jgi:ribosomal protein S24E
VIFLNIEILNKKENVLLSRIEVTAKMRFENATPSTDNVRDALSKALAVDKELVAVKKIDTAFGHKSAQVTVYQYFSKDELAKIEPKKKEKVVKKAE